ncbi:hypothetical protein [Oceanibacterium hippocampi]|uniref:Uncharacterized protein n=1 Tax=Oceanibacterium hippocampi TaxID=745714 RepID=A0A1Y5R6R5_9PROT|nr:hypothetical protein [Oceanibacterium hippocampi]SLN10486.1 hypothetical protein OCH7691_00043 [Oceanibacterium hippocampi]
MGTGILVLLLLLAAGYVLLTKFGWANAFRTLGNRATSRFVRSSADGGTTFEVVPARASRAALVLLISGAALCSQLWLEIIALFGLIPVTMGLLAFPIGARYRTPATITVSDQDIRSGDKAWPLSDVADLNLRRGSRIRTDEPPQVVHRTAGGGLVYGAQPTSAMFSRALNRRAVERSYLVTLRTRSGSDETVLSGGLTLECAQALQNDLRAEIAARQGAGAQNVA